MTQRPNPQMPPLTEGARYRIREGYLLRKIAGEAVIVPIASDAVITNGMMMPNDSAVFLWEAFIEPSTIDQVVEKGLQEYEVDEQTLRNAAQRFVTELKLLQILEEMD